MAVRSSRRTFMARLGAIVGVATSSDISFAQQAMTGRPRFYTRGAKIPENFGLRRLQQNIASAALNERYEKNAVLKDIFSYSYTPPEATVESLEKQYDWRERGFVTDVRDQGYCGSCFIFASLGAFESAYLIANNGAVPPIDPAYFEVSEQELLDCGVAEADCFKGGWHEFVLYYLSFLGAIDASRYSYNPYSTQKGLLCGSNWGKRKYMVRDWAYVSSSDPLPTTEALKVAIRKVGPVVCGVTTVSSDTEKSDPSAVWDIYSGGVITPIKSSGKEEDVNHEVLIVGWDDALKSSEGNLGAWIVKNSWGKNWGSTGTKDAGYVFVPYNRNNIGYGASWVKAYSKKSMELLRMQADLE